MNTKSIVTISSLLLLASARAGQPLEADFPTLTIGTNTFTNVHLRAFSPEFGSLRYDGGIEKVRLADLPEPVRSNFYHPSQPKPAAAKLPPPKGELITEAYASRINAFAEKFDMTVEEAMRWDYVLPKRGLSLADFDKALTKLNESRDKALGYHVEIPKRNAQGRRLKAGEVKPPQSNELSQKEEDVAKMLKLAGYP